MTGQLRLHVLIDPAQRRHELLREVRDGLTADAKSLSPIWFYDEVGSRLFDDITRLPEYYLTRAERAILAAHADEIAAAAGADCLVEIGSGTSEKTRLLLDAMAARDSLRRVVLLDISEEVLAEAAGRLCADYGVDVQAVVADLRTGLGAIPRSPGRWLWAFLGSTIGNFVPAARGQLLADFRAAMADGDRLLVGTDLVKDAGRLRAAYDDAAGVTAAFNRNVLAVLNRELHADFDPAGFEHRAVWNAAESRIEMRLRAVSPQTVTVADVELTAEFATGEELLTETSAKFRPGQIEAELAHSGLTVAGRWRDPAGDFQLTLAGPG